MIKKFFVLFLILIISCIIFLSSIDDFDYIKTQNKAKEYARNTYGTDVKFTKGIKGQSPWLNSRIDKFIFYDETNDFFFCIKNSYGRFTDDYISSKSGKDIDNSIYKLFNEQEKTKFIVSSKIYDDMDKNHIYTELIMFSQSEDYYSELYSLIKKIVYKFPNIDIKLVIADDGYKKRYVEYYSYISNENLTNIPFKYLGKLSSLDLNLNSEEKFIEYLNLNRISID